MSMFEILYKRAVWYLGKQQVSEARLQAYLQIFTKRNGLKCGEELINDVVKKCVKNQYISDENYATYLAESLRNKPGMSEKGLYYKLLLKKFPHSLIERTIETINNEYPDWEKKTLTQYMQAHPTLDKETILRRLYSRGYGRQLIEDLRLE